eukprot:5388196-Alexandrium_andersonii.AAC.1
MTQTSMSDRSCSRRTRASEPSPPRARPRRRKTREAARRNRGRGTAGKQSILSLPPPRRGQPLGAATAQAAT